MARPPVEWPIPVYVAEFRERVVATYHLPPARLAGLLPLEVSPDLVLGRAVVSLCLANGRCLKPVGGAPCLVSEYHVAELVTPVRWQAACRPVARGLYLLRLQTDSHSLNRLLCSALEFDARFGRQVQGPAQERYVARMEPAGAEFALPRPVREEPWPRTSLFPTAEAAEAHLLHPEYHFVADRERRVLRAVPVHQYARSTVYAGLSAAHAPGVSEVLGLSPGEAVLDHVVFQKRCTHTWFFPPERIPLCRPVQAAHSFRGADPGRVAA